MKRTIVAAGAALALLVGCGSAPIPGPGAVVATSDPNAPFTLTGTFTMPLSEVEKGTSSNSICWGGGGYSDIQEGAGVTVYDEASKIVATGALSVGRQSGSDCVWDVVVNDVPGTAKFYQVEISHRGKITVDAADAKAGLFGASLGNN